jgi:Zn-dependent protease/CBS domain-containing protein
MTNGDMHPPTAAVARPTPVPVFRWSWKLTSIAGIDIYVHATFLLLIAFFALGDLLGGRGIAVMMRSTSLILAVFATVVLHELGHALMARRFGIGTRDITLLPIGGIARLEKLPDAPGQQLLVAIAGPAVNVAIAVVLLGALLLFGGSFGFEGWGASGGSVLAQLMWINVSLAAFNLVPGYPMDGGRVLRALLAMQMPPERATQIAARVGQAVAIGFGFVGLFFSPILIVIAVFVWMGAHAERSISIQRVALSGLTVRDGMITDFKTIDSADTLGKAVALTLAGFQQDFPVMEDDELVGVLTHADVLRGLAEGGADMPVRTAVRPGLDTTDPRESLAGALGRIRSGECRVLMAMENDELVGLLTAANVGELISLGAAGRHGAAAPRPDQSDRESARPVT